MSVHEAIDVNDPERARELARASPALRERREDGLLPAMLALYRHDRALAEALLPEDEQLTVFEAAAFGRVSRLERLLSEEPSLARDFSPDGFTPLHLAAFAGGVDSARMLIRAGADVEAPSRHRAIRGVRPLGTAAFSRDLETARLLLASGADPNAPADGGFRPLHTAAANDDAALVGVLLSHGAEPGLRTDHGKSPLDLAREAESHEVAAMLEAAEPRNG